MEVPQVKAMFQLGSETYSVNANKGILSEQLVVLKEESMSILKAYITKHNVPIDVPDEVDEVSEDEEITTQKPKPKKRKLSSIAKYLFSTPSVSYMVLNM